MADDRQRQIYKVTLIGSAVNAGLVLLKFIAGFVGRSSAMIADAVHSLSDFATDIIVLLFVKISGKPRDTTHDYGHGKYETLAALIVGIILLAVGVGMLIEGIKSVIDAAHGSLLPRPGMIALIVAVISIVSKEILYRYTVKAGRTLNSSALVANAWHHRSDAISSLGTLFGIAGAMFLGEKWRILDPIAAIIVSGLIIKASWDIMRPSANELLEGSLPENIEKEIVTTIKNVSGVLGTSHLKTRRIGNTFAIDVNVKMDGNITLYAAHAIASNVEDALRMKFGKDIQISVHMEPFFIGAHQ